MVGRRRDITFKGDIINVKSITIHMKSYQYILTLEGYQLCTKTLDFRFVVEDTSTEPRIVFPILTV